MTGTESKGCIAPPYESAFLIVEVRIYKGLPSAGAEILALLNKHGLATVPEKELTFVSSFESLAERGEGWNRVAADENWHSIRRRAKLQLVSLVIYERLSDGDWDTSTA